MSYQLGIDLGTTFTSAAVNRDGRVEIVTLGSRAGAVPTVVLVRDDGTHVHAEAAAHRGLTEPDRLVREFKRRLGDARTIRAGDAELTVETLMASYLRWVVEQVTERQGGPPAEILLAHPANWGEHKMEALSRVIAAAGVGSVQLVPEPLAASIRYASHARVDEGALIATYDLGGGTFDVAILRKHAAGFELIGRPEGVEYLGGIDFDEAIYYRVKTQLGQRFLDASSQPGFAAADAALRRECRDAKEALSVEEEAIIPILLPGLSETVTITRQDFETMIRPSVEESIAATRRCLRNAGVEPEQLSHVLLVGGSSRTPLVARMLGEALNRPVATDTDPKYSVAEGAALYDDSVVAETAAPLAPTQPPPAAPAQAPPAAPTQAPPAAPTHAAPTHAVPVAAATASAGAAAPGSPVGGPPDGSTPGDGGNGAGSGIDLRVAAGVLVVGIIGLGALFLFTRNGDTEPEEAAVEGTVQNNEVIVVEGAGGLVAPAVPSAENMAAIGGGTYTVGLDDGLPEHAATQDVAIDDFFIDQFEVTNAAYADLVERGDAAAPAGWPDGQVPDDLADHPVVGVTLSEAEAFCGSIGKRLPSEAEWEATTRGGAGRLYPWGSDPDAVSLPSSGTHSVGSVPDAYTTEGVADLVGNAWEWVGEPYASVDDGASVLRGGENGDVRDGAFRFVADSSDPGVAAGFRCAATEVDFGSQEVTAGETIYDLAEAGLLFDDFDDPSSGWPIEEAETFVRGYHPPDFYHVEARGPNARVLAPRGVNFADVEVTTNVLVDHTDPGEARFRYGLLLRAEGISYYAFTIDPRSQVWAVIHDDSLGFRELATGPAPDIDGFRAQDELRVRLDGPEIQFFLNGELVHQLDTGNHHLRGDIGFFVENDDETTAHVHFEDIRIAELN